MNETSKTTNSRPGRWIRTALLVLALLTSPALCCGGLQLLDSIPSAWLPSYVDFIVNTFESSARLENKTSQTLYLTPITTTYGDPRVIAQSGTFKQRDIPVQPEASVELQYDAADLPLSGVIVCRDTQDCRLLRTGSASVYAVQDYKSLEPLEPAWLQARLASPSYDYAALLIIAFSLVPLILFSAWVYLGRRQKRLQASL